MGCLVLSKLAADFERALKIDLSAKFWCDSTTALSWIKSSATEFKPFVSVRVAEIQENQPNTVWNYITSEANPADALTRGYRQKNSSYGTKDLNFFKSQKVNGLTSNDLPRHPTQNQTQRKRTNRKSKVTPEKLTLKA